MGVVVWMGSTIAYMNKVLPQEFLNEVLPQETQVIVKKTKDEQTYFVDNREQHPTMEEG